MAQAQVSDRIHGCPREKNSVLLNLKDELHGKSRILRIDASLGVVGMSGTGRKTLAYRFAHMRHGIIQDGEVPTRYCYTGTFQGEFDPEHLDISYERFILKLTAYIIDPPAELPSHDPPLYLEKWNDFCCLVFVFDVRNQASFHEVFFKLVSFREANYRIPNRLLVGNKSDRRGEPIPLPEDSEYLNQRPVPQRIAYKEGEYMGACYYECSAQNNINVDRVFEVVKSWAIERKHWILENDG